MTYKPKHDLLKIEDINECLTSATTEQQRSQVWFAITLNPKAELGRHKFETFFGMQLALLKNLMRNCEFELYPESSPSGRIHFHGYVRITNIVEYIRDLPDLLDKFTVCIKFVEDCEEIGSDDDVKNRKYQTWQAYCEKQKNIFEKLCGIYQYPLRVIPDNALPGHVTIKVKKRPNELVSLSKPIDEMISESKEVDGSLSDNL